MTRPPGNVSLCFGNWKINFNVIYRYLNHITKNYLLVLLQHFGARDEVVGHMRIITIIILFLWKNGKTIVSRTIIQIYAKYLPFSLKFQWVGNGQTCIQNDIQFALKKNNIFF